MREVSVVPSNLAVHNQEEPSGSVNPIQTLGSTNKILSFDTFWILSIGVFAINHGYSYADGVLRMKGMMTSHEANAI